MPWAKIEKLRDFHSRFLPYLSEQVGIEAVLNITPDYGTLQKDMDAGNLQLAAFPPGAYADALIAIPDKMRYLATIVLNGEYFYTGYIFAKQNHKAMTLTDMKGGTIAFNEFGSSSGFKYPFSIFLKRGIDPDVFFSKIFFLGSHQSILKGVYKGRVDFGATYDRVYNSFQKVHGHPFKIIKQYKMPYGVFVASKNMPDKIFKKIQNALVGLNKKTRLKNGELVLQNDFYLSGFIVKGNRIYDDVRKIVRLIDNYRKEHRY